MNDDIYRDKFGGSLRILNQVPRWSCVPRIKENNVAQHSFWVVFYSQILCDYLELDSSEKLAIIDYAMRHDLGEAASGDIMGPVKRSAVDETSLRRYIQRSFEQWGCYQFLQGLWRSDIHHIRAIIKAADIIDDLMVMSEEMALGNQRAEHLYHIAAARLVKALRRIDCSALYDKIIESCAIARSSPIIIIQEDSDVTEQFESDRLQGITGKKKRPPPSNDD